MRQRIHRLCKVFEVESGHRLSKHPGRCRFPHGHTRKIEVVLAAAELDERDMVVDFAAIKALAAEIVDRFDHSIALSSDDTELESFRAFAERVVVFEGCDPTTEAMAEVIFDELEDLLAETSSVRDAKGIEHEIRHSVRLERVRVWETSSSWAEVALEAR